MSEYIGFMGEKNTFFLKLVSTKKVDTQWNTRLVVNCVTRTGKVCNIWVATDNKDFTTLSIGDCFTVTGTVTKQEYNNYTESYVTTISRVKFIENVTKKQQLVDNTQD